MKTKKILTPGIVLVLFFGYGLSLKCKQQDAALEELLAKGDFKKAEAFCLHQPQKTRGECLRRLADALLAQNDFENAARCCEKSDYKEGFDKIADHYSSKGDYQKAIQYYKKGGSNAAMAQAYGRLGDFYRDSGNPSEAKNYYNQAVLEYENAIKTFNYQWNNAHINDRKRCLREINKFPKSEREKTDQAKLVTILKKTADYCEQLEKSSIYFFCSEEVIEKVDYTRRKLENIVATYSETRSIFYMGRRRKVKPSKSKRTYLYQYQLVKEKPGDEPLESRILLKKDGRKKRQENAQLQTGYYRHSKVLFGPIGLLSKYWQRFYDYKILGEEMRNGEKTVVVEAIPVLDRKGNTLFGKVWVRAEDFSIAKIEWNPNSVQSIEMINSIAKLFGEKPSVTFISEFDKERGGIRFPTRFYIEEAYFNPEGEKFVRLETDVIYKDYKFFNVQIGEIKYEDQ